jgi:hypothetical protein
MRGYGVAVVAVGDVVAVTVAVGTYVKDRTTSA